MAYWLIFLVVVGAAVAADVGEERQERIFGLPELFTIKPFECELKDNEGTGTCYTSSDCMAKNGTALGKCALFGVCCYIGDVEGNTTISSTGGTFTSPSSASARSARSLESSYFVAVLNPGKTEENINNKKVQMLLEFVSFEIMEPTEGDCAMDMMEIVGTSGPVQIPILCGNNSGQHMYIDISNYNSSVGGMEIQITLSADVYAREWEIKVSYLTAIVPPSPFCLQYFAETNGTIHSFNSGGLTPQYLNNQTYSVCFAYVSEYCDIDFTFNSLNLDKTIGSCADDFVQIQSQQLCGVETAYTITGNATGPITMSVSSDSANTNLVEGFDLTYAMKTC